MKKGGFISRPSLFGYGPAYDVVSYFTVQP